MNEHVTHLYISLAAQLLSSTTDHHHSSHTQYFICTALTFPSAVIGCCILPCFASLQALLSSHIPILPLSSLHLSVVCHSLTRGPVWLANHPSHTFIANACQINFAYHTKNTWRFIHAYSHSQYWKAINSHSQHSQLRLLIALPILSYNTLAELAPLYCTTNTLHLYNFPFILEHLPACHKCYLVIFMHVSDCGS